MTTIAVDLDRGAMASDSRASADGFFATEKLFQIANGSLVGFCGVATDGLQFADWFAAGCNRKQLPVFSDKQTFNAITLGPDGCFMWDNDCVPIPMRERRYAIGSGGQAARAALSCGKSLEEAIEIACAIDPCSGLPVVCSEYKRMSRSRKGKISLSPNA